MNDSISVCMATYNGEKYIAAQLQSILGQLGDNDEIIISDDSSTDRTIEIIENFRDGRIKILRGQSFKSPIYNFENALKNARNEFIFLSDQDDIWTQSRVEVCKTYLKESDVVVCDANVIDNEMNITNDSFFATRNSGPGLVKNLFRNSYLGCCMAFKKNLLNVALPFPDKIPMHDIWLGFVAEISFKSIFIDDKLVLYRRHTDNATTTGGLSNNNLWNKLLLRVNLIRYLPKVILRTF